MIKLTDLQRNKAIRFAALALQGGDDDAFSNYMRDHHNMGHDESTIFFNTYEEEIYMLESHITAWLTEGKPIPRFVVYEK